MSKKYFTPNYIDKTIEGTKAAFKKAGVMNSPAFNELREWMELFPTFTVTEVSPKENKNKKTYNGLSIEKMKEYIGTQSNSELMLKKFEAVQRVAKAKNALYPLTKKWFLNAYPEYKLNSVSENEAAAAQNETADQVETNDQKEAARLAQEAATELEALIKPAA